jgi:hypothetical protein
MRDENKNGICGFVFRFVVMVIVMIVMIIWMLIAVPIQHGYQSIAKAQMHATPFLPVLSTVAPILRIPHAVPLVIHIDTGIPRMSHISRWDRIGGRDRVGRDRWQIAVRKVLIRMMMPSGQNITYGNRFPRPAVRKIWAPLGSQLR